MCTSLMGRGSHLTVFWTMKDTSVQTNKVVNLFEHNNVETTYGGGGGDGPSLQDLLESFVKLSETQKLMGEAIANLHANQCVIIERIEALEQKPKSRPIPILASVIAVCFTLLLVMG